MEETPFHDFRGDKGGEVCDNDDDIGGEKCNKPKSVEVGEAVELPPPQLWQNKQQLFDLETWLKSLLVFLLQVISFEEFWELTGKILS
ncbi:MFS transporter [Sesbania bispinosa]|nr:MFS transporter [Sesbania bispinosa]